MERLVLKNMMEPLIENKLNECIDKFDCCKCETCRLDILAYALNMYPPKYVVTHMGELYAKLQTLSLQYDTDLLTAISKAVVVISKKPRHE